MSSRLFSFRIWFLLVFHVSLLEMLTEMICRDLKYCMWCDGDDFSQHMHCCMTSQKGPPRFKRQRCHHNMSTPSFLHVEKWSLEKVSVFNSVCSSPLPTLPEQTQKCNQMSNTQSLLGLWEISRDLLPRWMVLHFFLALSVCARLCCASAWPCWMIFRQIYG